MCAYNVVPANALLSLCDTICSSIQTDQLEELIFYALSELAGEPSDSIRDASKNIVKFETYLAGVSTIKKTNLPIAD